MNRERLWRRSSRRSQRRPVEGQASGHEMSLCMALSLGACATSLWVGDLTVATRYTRMLLDHSNEHSPQHWQLFGTKFHKAILIRRGDADAGAPSPRPDADQFAEPGIRLRSFSGLAELAEGFVAERIEEAAAMVRVRLEQSDGGWIAPELLRLKGEVLLSSAPEGSQDPEALFRRALGEARRHEALSFELRAALSLARLLRDRHRPLEAISCLGPVYARFTEGFGTTDLVAAKTLLDELGSSYPQPGTGPAMSDRVDPPPPQAAAQVVPRGAL